jgi:hypothetical protein
MKNFTLDDINFEKTEIEGYHYEIQHLAKDGKWTTLQDCTTFDSNIKIGVVGYSPEQGLDAITKALARLVSKKRQSKEFRIIKTIRFNEIIETGITMDSAQKRVNEQVKEKLGGN